MNRITKTTMRALLTDWRARVPNRPMTYGESVHFTHVQAAYVRKYAATDDALAIDLLWLVKQTAVPVEFVASYLLGEESGLTTDQRTGKLEMLINDNEPRLRQRFSLLHELKHVLDFPQASTLHAKLGSGNTKLHHDMIEWLANEFAAHVLMPTGLIKREWFRFPDVETLAALFDVSREAMTTRLEKLGLIGEPKTKPRTYFRRASIGFGAFEPETRLIA